MPADHFYSIKNPTIGAHQVQLLVSVRDEIEATEALRQGVNWIDLKEPSQGSLGRPDGRIAANVSRLLQSANHQAASVALGELDELQLEDACAMAKYFSVLKVGLANSTASDWRRKLLSLAAAIHELSGQLVPVIYADANLCGAVEDRAVLDAANELKVHFGSRYLLVDTFVKDGRSLLDHWSLSEVQRLKKETDKIGLRLVLAGSLQAKHVTMLAVLEPYALAVRGAVCDGSRQGRLCPTKIAELKELLSSGRTGSV